VRINLRDIPDGITAIEVAKPDGSPDLPGFSDIGGRLTLDRNGDILRITGRLAYACRLECSRCLGWFRLEAQEPVEIYFRPQQAGETAGHREGELKADDLSVLTYRGAELDLWPAIRESLELARPLKPLCRQDCRGICHGCGRDLNREACRCAPDPEDPRWEALRALSGKGGAGKKGRARKGAGGS